MSLAASGGTAGCSSGKLLGLWWLSAAVGAYAAHQLFRYRKGGAGDLPSAQITSQHQSAAAAGVGDGCVAVPTPSRLRRNVSGGRFRGCYERMPSATRLVMVDTEERCNAEVETLLKDEREGEPWVFGFDVEWVSNPKELPIALIQLSSQRTTLLIRLRLRVEAVNGLRTVGIPDQLRAVLADPKYLKVGVAVQDDAKRLERDHGLTVRGCVDLSALYIRTRDPMKVKAVVAATGVASTTTTTSTGSVTGTTAVSVAASAAAAGSTEPAPALAALAQHNLSLQRLTRLLLGVAIPKDRAIRCSDWEVPTLSGAQMFYAASDSFYSRACFVALYEMKRGVQSGAEALPWTHNALRGWCAGLIDARRSVGRTQHAGDRRTAADEKGKTAPSTHEHTHKAKKAHRMPHRKRDLYENCRMYSQNGTLLAMVNRKRLQWYLQRGLAEVYNAPPLPKAADIPDSKKSGLSHCASPRLAERHCSSKKSGLSHCASPGLVKADASTEKSPDFLAERHRSSKTGDPGGGELAIRLKFTPKGNGKAYIPESDLNSVDAATSQFFLTRFENRCVVCGSNESLRCHSVVPRGLRQHFPILYKSRSSHDILLMCSACSLRLERLNDLLVVTVCRELKIRPPYNHWTAEEKHALEELKAVNKALAGLSGHLRGKYVLPHARVHDIEELVRGEYRRRFPELPVPQQIGEAEIAKAEYVLPPFDRHYEEMAKHYAAQNAIPTFCKRWRIHFVEQMKPKYLSSHWSVDHEERLVEQDEQQQHKVAVPRQNNDSKP